MLQGYSSPPRSESSAALVTLLPTFRVVLSLVAQLALRGHESDSDSDESPRSHSGVVSPYSALYHSLIRLARAAYTASFAAALAGMPFM